MSVKRLFNLREQFSDSNGTPLSGGLLFVYLAGSSTKATTYSDSAGAVPNSNPLVMNSAGRPQVEIWVTTGLSYKLILALSTDADPPVSPLWTEDNISGIGDNLTAFDQWFAGPAPTYVSATSFTLAGDQTTIFEVGRRVKVTDSGGTKYGTIKISAFTTLTTITLDSQDSDALASPTSAVSYGIQSASSTSHPVFSDAIAIAGGSADRSKRLRFEADGITTATTRVRYAADEDSASAQSWEIQNFTFTASVAANALTFAVKTKTGNDASAADPILFKFRSATLTSGIYTVRTLTAAASLVISAGSTLGFSASETRRVYFGAIDNAGAVELCAWDSLLGTVAAPTGLFAVNESGVVSTTAEGGAGAADAAGVLYSTTARSNLPVRVLGYIEIQTGATPGNWSNAPTVLQVMGPGVLRTGAVVASLITQTGTSATGTTTTPADNTIPQNTEGDQYMTLSITPLSALNILSIKSLAIAAHSAGGTFAFALFQDAVANALKAVTQAVVAASTATVLLLHTMLAGTTSSTAFKIRIGNSVAGTTTFNGFGGTQIYGGVAGSMISVEEIFA